MKVKLKIKGTRKKNSMSYKIKKLANKIKLKLIWISISVKLLKPHS